MSQPSQRRAHFLTFAFENLWLSILPTVRANALIVPATRCGIAISSKPVLKSQNSFVLRKFLDLSIPH